jgi:hypothetical protein
MNVYVKIISDSSKSQSNKIHTPGQKTVVEQIGAYTNAVEQNLDKQNAVKQNAIDKMQSNKNSRTKVLEQNASAPQTRLPFCVCMYIRFPPLSAICFCPNQAVAK